MHVFNLRSGFGIIETSLELYLRRLTWGRSFAKNYNSNSSLFFLSMCNVTQLQYTKNLPYCMVLFRGHPKISKDQNATNFVIYLEYMYYKDWYNGFIQKIKKNNPADGIFLFVTFLRRTLFTFFLFSILFSLLQYSIIYSCNFTQ